MEEKMPVNEYEEKLMHPKTVETFFSQMGNETQPAFGEFLKREKRHRSALLEIIFGGKNPMNGEIRKFLVGLNKPEISKLRKDEKLRNETARHLEKISEEALKMIEASRSIAGKHETFGKSYGEWDRYRETIRRNCSAMRRDAKGMLGRMKLKNL